MKMFSRDFTRTEKILIAILALILLALVYYQFVDKTVRDTITYANIEARSLETQIEAAQAKAVRLASLQRSMDELREKGELSWMPSYNASKPEVAFLNDVLKDTLSYSVEFASVTRSGDQIRRSFKLRYATGGYRAAREIIEALRSGENRCIVGDITCKISTLGLTSVDASATFYETMVEGTPDAGLPADSAAAKQ